MRVQIVFSPSIGDKYYVFDFFCLVYIIIYQCINKFTFGNIVQNVIFFLLLPQWCDLYSGGTTAETRLR